MSNKLRRNRPASSPSGGAPGLKSHQVTVMFDDEQKVATVNVQLVIKFAARRDVRAIADLLQARVQELEQEVKPGAQKA